jgi:hypothetical protein
MLREAAQQALEALEQCGLDDTHRSYEFEHVARIALRAALAQQEQEPAIYPDEAREMGLEEVALYTYPPCREWQGLTEEELDRWTPEIHSVIRAVEQALKEKNA